MIPINVEMKRNATKGSERELRRGLKSPIKGLRTHGKAVKDSLSFSKKSIPKKPFGSF